MATVASDKSALIGGAGLGFHIAWAYFFWDGSLLMGALGGVEGATSSAVIVHIGVAGLCSLVIALLASRIGSLFARPRLHGAFALIAAVSVPLAALAGNSSFPLTLAVVGFAVGGLGSMQRLAWEEYLSVRGVKTLALALPVAYAAAIVLYAAASMLARPLALAVAALLPLVSFEILRRTALAYPVPAELMELMESRERSTFAALPVDGWRFMGVLTLIYFVNGVMRPSSVAWIGSQLALAPAAITALTAVPSMLAIIVAYALYRRRPMLTFYIAFPLMALFSLIPSSWDPYSAGFTFCVALVGMEFWFFFIDSIVKDGVSALMCVGLLQAAQWIGGAAGRWSALAQPGAINASTIVLFTLVIVLLIMTGFMTLSRQYAADSEVDDEGSQESASVGIGLDRRVRAASEQFGLTPREEEILAIWAAGRTSAYIESRLFISKNTVRTHLKHIYTKTSTANREDLMQLLDKLDA